MVILSLRFFQDYIVFDLEFEVFRLHSLSSRCSPTQYEPEKLLTPPHPVFPLSRSSFCLIFFFPPSRFRSFVVFVAFVMATMVAPPQSSLPNASIDTAHEDMIVSALAMLLLKMVLLAEPVCVVTCSYQGSCRYSLGSLNGGKRWSGPM